MYISTPIYGNKFVTVGRAVKDSLNETPEEASGLEQGDSRGTP